MEIKIDNIFKKIFTLLIITTMISIPLLELFGTLFLKEKFFYQEEFLSFISIVCIFFIFQYLFVYKKRKVNYFNFPFAPLTPFAAKPAKILLSNECVLLNLFLYSLIPILIISSNTCVKLISLASHK